MNLSRMIRKKIAVILIQLLFRPMTELPQAFPVELLMRIFVLTIFSGAFNKAA